MGPFVGRDAAFERLLSAAGNREGGFAMVVGEGGVGKSRLLDTVRQAVDGRQTIGITVRPEPRDPLEWTQLLLQEMGVGRVPYDRTLGAEDRRWDVAAVLRGALEDAGPLLVTIDDIHLAHESSLEVFESVVPVTQMGRLSVVASARPSSSTMIETLQRSAVVVELGPLSSDAIAELAEALQIDLDSEEVGAITGGLPLLIHQLAWGTDSSVRGMDIVRRRIAVLPAETVRLLEVMALEPDAPARVTTAALEVDVGGLELLAQPARAAGVLGENGEFAHTLMAETVVDSLSPMDVRRLHSRLAAAWRDIDSLEARIEVSRHQIAAVPLVEPDSTADEAISLSSDLTDVGRPEVALELLESLVGVLDDHLPGDPERRARMLVAMSNARWELGEVNPSLRLGGEAAELSQVLSDPRLQGLAEIAATRHHDTIRPDPVRLERVLDVSTELPDDDPIRARLLGRAAVLSMTALDVERAHHLADEGLEIARRLDDPELEVQLLTDRHLSVVDRAGFEDREVLGASVVGLAAQTGRSDLALVGHQWVAGGRIQRGDLLGATAELDRLEIRAALRPTPMWRLAVLFRRMTILGMIGPRDAALDLATDTWERLGDVLGEEERPGVELEYRASLWRLYGVADDRIEEIHEQLFPGHSPPVPFIAIRAGIHAQHEGDTDALRPLVRRWAPRSRDVVRSFMGLPTMAILATMTARVGEAKLCRAVVDALKPFSGLLATDNGIGVNPPVDTLIAMNLLAVDDLAEAETYAAAGRDLAAGSGADPLVVKASETLLAVRRQFGEDVTEDEVVLVETARRAGVILESDPPMEANTETRVGRFTRDGESWHIESPYGAATVAHTRGTAQLADVLAAAGAELAALDLVASGPVPVESDVGPALDGMAKRAYRHRIADLEAEIEEARRFNDPARAEQAQHELDAIMTELRAAVGLGGRDRPQKSSDERARVNVTRSIRRAIDSISDRLPELGGHLDVSINTGRRCSYRPDPVAAVNWQVDR